MQEDNVKVSISMPSLKDRIARQDEYNAVLDNFRNYLQSTYGTSNLQQALTIALTVTLVQLGLNIASASLALKSFSQLAKLPITTPVAPKPRWIEAPDVTVMILYEELDEMFEGMEMYVPPLQEIKVGRKLR